MLIGAASALIGCSNPFGEKIPTPWSKTEGREEVVGSPTRADDEPVDEGVIRGVDQDRTGSNLIAEPNVIEEPNDSVNCHILSRGSADRNSWSRHVFGKMVKLWMRTDNISL